MRKATCLHPCAREICAIVSCAIIIYKVCERECIQLRWRGRSAPNENWFLRIITYIYIAIQPDSRMPSPFSSISQLELVYFRETDYSRIAVVRFHTHISWHFNFNKRKSMALSRIGSSADLANLFARSSYAGRFIKFSLFTWAFMFFFPSEISELSLWS